MSAPTTLLLEENHTEKNVTVKNVTVKLAYKTWSEKLLKQKNFEEEHLS